AFPGADLPRALPTVTSAVPAAGSPASPAAGGAGGGTTAVGGASTGAVPGRVAPGGATAPQPVLDHVPMSFEVNRGQAPAQVQFLAHAGGYDLSLPGARATMVLGQPQAAPGSVDAASPLDLRLPPGVDGPDPGHPETTTLGLEFVGANPAT